MPNQIKTIGYPFVRTYYGMFNPISNIKDNAKCKLINLLYTIKGQRILGQNCQFGLNLTKLLFENMNYENYQSSISKQIEKSVKKWIPEITETKIIIEKLQNSFIVTVNFKVNQKYDSVSLELKMNE